MYFVAKVFLTAIIIAAVSELAKRYSMAAAILVSLPLTSILSFIWIYHEGRDVTKIITMSYDIVWLVLPSCFFFILLPVLLKVKLGFYPALLLSCIGMAMFYVLFIWVKQSIFLK